MNKNIILIGIVIVVAAIAGGWLYRQSATIPEGAPMTPPDTEKIISPVAPAEEAELKNILEGEDTTAAIEEDLEGITVDDLEGEFNEIDQDLEGL